MNSSPALARKPRFFYGWVIVISACLVILTMYGTLNTFGVFFESMLKEFGWSHAMVATGFSVVIWVRSVLYLITGRLTDRYGPRVVVSVCGVLLGAAYLLMSQINAIWQFYLLYTLVGFGMSSAWIPQVSTVARWFEKKRGLATSLAAMGEGLGLAIMVPLARWLVGVMGWRLSYMVVGVIGLVVIVAAAQFMKRDPAKMGLRPYGAGEIRDSASTPQIKGLLLGQAVRTREFWILALVYFSILFGLETVLTQIVVYIEGIGITLAISAQIVATIGVSAVLGRIAMGALSDRSGAKMSIIICMVILTLAWLWLQFAGSSVWMLFLFAMSFGFVFGGSLIQFPIMVAQRFGLTSHGAIMGMLSLVSMATAAFGPILVGHMFDVTGSYLGGFAICGAVSGVGLVLSFFSRPVRELS